MTPVNTERTKAKQTLAIFQRLRALSSRPLSLGAGGRSFEYCRPDQLSQGLSEMPASDRPGNRPGNLRSPRPSILAALIVGGAITAAAALYVPGIRVVDGDTIDHGWRRWRLAGIDAPEVRRAQCDAEAIAGAHARQTLRILVEEAGDDWRLEPVPSAPRDPYGRVIGRLLLAGHDASETLIAAGLVRPYAGGRRAGWCAAGE